MSIGARPFPFHFRYCKTFRIKYIFLPAFCFISKPFAGFCTLAKLFVAVVSGTLCAVAIIAVVSFIVQVQA